MTTTTKTVSFLFTSPVGADDVRAIENSEKDKRSRKKGGGRNT